MFSTTTNGERIVIKIKSKRSVNMNVTENSVYAGVVGSYLNDLDVKNPPSPFEIESVLLEKLLFEIQKENSTRDKGHKIKIPTVLPEFIVASIILKLYNIKNIMWSDDGDTDNSDLFLYQTEGANKGIYTSDSKMFKRLVRLYNPKASIKYVEEVIDILSSNAPCCNSNLDKNLIAVNNGIFNYETKKLMPFSPDVIFTSKSRVDYNPNAKNVILHNFEDNTNWDIESWIKDLSDNSEIVDLIWQVIGASIRPNVRWNKVVCFYSEQGNNGKGTLCELIRNICGAGNTASIPFDSFGKEFALEQLTRVSAIVTDENTTKSFSKETASLKAIITGDCFSVNRKFKPIITMKFNGLMVQCVNDLPRFGDKSESLYRRLLFIPFEKCFTGVERKYIKDDYLNKKEVLEYVLFKVLNMNYNQFSDPAECQKLLAGYKIFNDPVRDFLDDVLDQFVWTLVPYNFLYDLYKSWFKENYPSGQIVNRKSFLNDVKEILRKNTEWEFAEVPYKSKSKMDKTELLIMRYNLTHWMADYNGSDPKKICNFVRKDSYRGLIKL